MDDIKKLGHNIWLVHGHVIGTRYEGVFDDTTPEGRAILIDVADNTCNGPLFPRKGDLMYAAFFKNASQVIPGRFLFCGQPHLSELPEDVKAALRKEMPQYASAF